MAWNTSALPAASNSRRFSSGSSGMTGVCFISPPSRIFCASSNVFANPSHPIATAKSWISSKAFRKESRLFAKRGFFAGGTEYSCSVYTMSHMFFWRSVYHPDVKHVARPSSKKQRIHAWAVLANPNSSLFSTATGQRNFTSSSPRRLLYANHDGTSGAAYTFLPNLPKNLFTGRKVKEIFSCAGGVYCMPPPV